MRCFFDTRQLDHAPDRELHNGDWMAYSEKPSRARDIAGQVGCQPGKDFGIAPIMAVHDEDYIAFLKTAWTEWRSNGRAGDAVPYVFPVVHRRDLTLDRIDAKLGRFSYDAGTPIAEQTWDAAYWSAQTALTGLDAIRQEGAAHAFALCRPPGHHAGRDYLGGYCYLNNAAIAAMQAHNQGMGPVAILDVDYHHGNGTQAIFYERSDVQVINLHADPRQEYPYFLGHADEEGAGEGEGFNHNYPLPLGTEWVRWCEALEEARAKIAAYAPDALVVSLGVDTFQGDPISQFRLQTEHFPQIGERIARLNLPTLFVMEGGYAVEAIGVNAVGVLGGFEGG